MFIYIFKCNLILKNIFVKFYLHKLKFCFNFFTRDIIKNKTFTKTMPDLPKSLKYANTEKQEKIRMYLKKLYQSRSFIKLNAIPHTLIRRKYPALYIPSPPIVYQAIEGRLNTNIYFLIGMTQALGGHPYELLKIYFEELKNEPPKLLQGELDKLKKDANYKFPPEIIEVFEFVISYLRLFLNDDIVRMIKDEDIYAYNPVARQVFDIIAGYNVKPDPEMISKITEYIEQISGKKHERKSTDGS